MSLDVCSSAPDLTLDAVVAVSTDVWACFLGADQELLPAFEPRGPVAQGYVSSVTVTGAWNGHVILELTEEAALLAARAMVGTPDVGPGEVTDAVGELVNMVGGNVKSLMPGPSALTLPVVAAGRAAHSTDVAEVARFDALWCGEPVRVSVHAPQS